MSEQPNLPEIAADENERRALLEAIIYVAEEPLSVDDIASGLQLSAETVRSDLESLVARFSESRHGIEIRRVAGGYKMFTKAEHHEVVRRFVKGLRPKLKLSLPALETLAVIAYKQPVTVPEIQAIRGVNAAAVIHTLLRHKLVNTAGRKQVIGRPMLYRTTREFLIQFGLNDLSELPSLKELEELSRAALGEDVAAGGEASPELAEPETVRPESASSEVETEAPQAAPAESTTDPADDQPAAKAKAAP